ncbi:hypothetical protein [Nocardia otitidiscaviarum]|uniref:hypothetical protein n=1 Tax=Nocardia otitidiscaviarum TaxID=1823 RepID=UPI0011DD39D8|nr:hypothetical protein [Nocardia otitidiscaviarum]
MIDQFVPMLGVLLGSLTTYVGTAAAEPARFRRLLTTRWDESKLEAYAEYASSVKAMLRAANRYAEARDKGTDLGLLRSDLEDADNHRSTVFERLVLLGNPTVSDAANQVKRLVLESKRIAIEHPSPAEPHVGGGDVVAALNVLHEVARKDLGIIAHPTQRRSTRPPSPR